MRGQGLFKKNEQGQQWTWSSLCCSIAEVTCLHAYSNWQRQSFPLQYWRLGDLYFTFKTEKPAHSMWPKATNHPKWSERIIRCTSYLVIVYEAITRSRLVVGFYEDMLWNLVAQAEQTTSQSCLNLSGIESCSRPSLIKKSKRLFNKLTPPLANVRAVSHVSPADKHFLSILVKQSLFWHCSALMI